MTLEQYNQLPYDYAHCAGTHCEKASQCLRHTAYKMLEMGWTGAVYDSELECDCGHTALSVLRFQPQGTFCMGNITNI